MISKNWPRRSATVCVISLLTAGLMPAQPAVSKPAPAIALLDAADAPQWQSIVEGSGWQILTATPDADANIDKRVQALALKVGRGREGRDSRHQPDLPGRTRRRHPSRLLRHLANARPVGGRDRSGRLAKGSNRHQSHFRHQFHQYAGALGQHGRQRFGIRQASETCRPESGMAAFERAETIAACWNGWPPTCGPSSRSRWIARRIRRPSRVAIGCSLPSSTLRSATTWCR